MCTYVLIGYLRTTKFCQLGSIKVGKSVFGRHATAATGSTTRAEAHAFSLWISSPGGAPSAAKGERTKVARL